MGEGLIPSHLILKLFRPGVPLQGTFPYKEHSLTGNFPYKEHSWIRNVPSQVTSFPGNIPLQRTKQLSSYTRNVTLRGTF